MPKSSKGSQFERDFCRQLSIWWSRGVLEKEDDDLFWRTSNSGGRATTRRKSNKDTRGHYGDIGATDKDGEPLIKLITFELKRGYNKASISDLIYKSKTKKKPSIYEEWIIKLQHTCEEAGTEYWALVHQPDYKEPMILFDERIADDYVFIPSARVETEELGNFMIVRLEDFFKQVDANDIYTLAKKRRLI